MRFKNYSYFLLTIIVSICSSIYGQDVHKSESNAMIRFTENKNQWDKKIFYTAQLDGGAMFLEKNGFTYNFYDKETLMEVHSGKRSKNKTIASHAFQMMFLNSLETVRIESKNPTSDYCNYFIGNEEKKWAKRVKNYREVRYISLYQHINLEMQGLQNSLKYNFIVEPLGNTDDIKMVYEGLDKISLDKGALRLKTRLNEIVEHSPFAYQWIGSKQINVPCEFVLENNVVRFHFPNGYNKGYELIIDPQVVFSASTGATSSNFGHSCTYDSDGNLYSGGISFGAGYPLKNGYDASFNLGRVDVVVTKFGNKGDSLMYSTFIGGNSDEIITSMIVDAEDKLVFYGVTGSANFPTTASAYSRDFKYGKAYYPHWYNGNIFPSGTDVFVSKFNAKGDSLIASTYIGGSGNDGINCSDIANMWDGTTLNGQPLYTYELDSLQYNYGDYYRGEIDLDKFGDVYVVTSTRSNDFPIKNGFDSVLTGNQDAVIFKMNSDLSRLEWSSYLGGNNNDAGYALVLDEASNVYVTGGTRSSNFPTTNGVVQPNPTGGKADGYVTKIKNDGTSVLASTYWGTKYYDQSFFVQLDNNNDVYLFGQSDGRRPIKGTVYNNPNSGQFVTKMNNQFTDVLFTTLIGNNDTLPHICPTAFLVDVCGNIYVAGWAARFNKYEIGDTADIPTLNMPTKNAPDSTTTGFDFYLMVLSKNAESLLCGTYWGGNESGEHVHGGTSRFDKRGIVYQSLCTGCGGKDDYPIRPYTNATWPHDRTNPNGSLSGCNNAVFKIDFEVKLVKANLTVDQTKGCAPLTVRFKNQSNSGKFLWDFGNGDTSSVKTNPIYTFNDPGIYVVKLYVNDPASCNIWDSVYQYITVYESITTDFDFTSAPCSNEIKFKDESVKTPVSWQWDFGDGNTSSTQHPIHTYKNFNTKYPVTLITKNVNGCSDTTTVDINFVGYNTTISAGKTICKGGNVQLTATGGFEYKWIPGTSLSDSTISNPLATPDTTTTYKVFIKTRNALGDTCVSELSTTIKVIDLSKLNMIATTDKDTVIKGESTFIHAITDTTLKIYWQPQTGVENPTAFNTLVTPLVTTTYTVTINDSLGCSKSATVTIYVVSNECEQTNVFVPNTFTPNGDGQNDILYARSNTVSTIYFAVYNRWGELMFETTDLKSGWNGNYKGMKVDPAVFAWYVKGKCYNGKEFFKKGNVTLIR